MGLFLDNAVSTKDAPNENLGRELLELHTVGVEAGYTEDDVKASSRMLTGYRVDTWWPEFRSFYDPRVHATGTIKVLDFEHPNTDADGRAATKAYLRHLAHHPATARRIARRLCVKFVSDNPSAGLVAHVAAAYRRSGTKIRPTLLALVDHPEFAASAGAKVRMPAEDYIASVRALRVGLRPPRDEQSFVNAMYWQYVGFGQAPYEWPAPNGFPEVGAAWTSAGRLLNGMGHHVNLAAGWWPTQDATRPRPGGLASRAAGDPGHGHRPRRTPAARATALRRRTPRCGDGAGAAALTPDDRRPTCGTGGSRSSWPPSSTPRPTSTAEGPDMTQTREPRPCGCPELGSALALSRRRFLAGVAAGTGALTATTMFGDSFRQVSYGATRGGNVLVVLSLRGGSDGLSMVVPRSSTDHDRLRQLRPGIALPTASLLGADPVFGLHPEFAPLLPMWQNGSFGAVHAVGLPAPNRSHFDAMAAIEDADPGTSARVGWINRTIGLDATAQPETAVQLGSTLLPTSLAGPAPAIGAREVRDLSLTTLGSGAAARRASLEEMWEPEAGLLGTSMRNTLATVGRLAPLVDSAADDAPGGSSVHTAAYPQGSVAGGPGQHRRAHPRRRRHPHRDRRLRRLGHALGPRRGRPDDGVDGRPGPPPRRLAGGVLHRPGSRRPRGSRS